MLADDGDGTAGGTSTGGLFLGASQDMALYHDGTDSVINNVTGGLLIAHNGTTRIETDGTGIGFFNTAPAAKPTVTGSRGGNAALASLLTGLAGLGLLTDSSSA